MTWHWCPYTSRRVSFLPMRPKYSNDGGSFLIIRDEHLLITGGNVVAAVLIHIFEHWHYHKLAQNKQNREANDIADGHHATRSFTETLYQWHTSESLERQLKGLGKKDSIIKARKVLVDLGIISEHKNPNPDFHYDKTVHFLFYPDVLAELINGADKNRVTSSENRQAPPLKNGETSSENRQHQYISSIDNSKDSSAQPRGANQKKAQEKKPAKDPPPKKEPRPPREHWQPFVETWHEFYKAKKHGEEPTIAGKALADLRKLYDLLQLRARRKKVQDWTEKYLVDAFNFFLGAAYSDDWLSKHFLLGNLVEQFDAVFAREADKSKGKATAKPFAEEIQYIIERWKEGDMDQRLITPELYKKLEDKQIVPMGYREQFTGKDPDEQKCNAVRGWLDYITKKSATA